MALKKFDESPFLQAGEKTVHKAHAPKSRSLIVEMVFCYLFWILSLSGGCFVISAGIGMTQYETLESGYILIVILLLFINLVPFGFWLAHIFKNIYKRSERWYVLTDKRLLTVTENKPTVVTVLNLSEVTEVTASKKTIYITAGETRAKITGVSDITAFLNRLEILVFGNDNDEQEMMQELTNPETQNPETQGEPAVWVE